jgi:hypothetical protein
MTPVGLSLLVGEAARTVSDLVSLADPARLQLRYDATARNKSPCSCSLFSIAVRIKSDILRSVAKDKRYETDSCSVCRDRGFVGDRR